MSEKELEERVMLNKKQYLEIEKYIKGNCPSFRVIHQKNRYFDDKNRTIKNLKNVLRIRSFKGNSKRELTYKIKGEEADIEYNQSLTHYYFYQITRYSHLPEGIVKDQLIKDGIDINSLKMIVDLYTRRIEVEMDNYLLVLDANLYNDTSDYNLEIESTISREHAKDTVLQYCEMFNLEYSSDYITKSQRAFNSIKK